MIMNNLMLLFKSIQGFFFCMGDKGELYIYFTPLYLVFCLVYHKFWVFYVCFYLLGDVRAKESKNEQLGVKRSNFGQNKRACRGIVNSCRDMSTFGRLNTKNPRPTCRSMPNSCRGMAVLMCKT